MAYVVGVLVSLVVVLASIALHEVGHMVPAKRFGVRVSQYMVGFGPTLWSRTRGETEYGLKAIPLGGYVRLVGMYPTGDAVGASEPRGWAGRLAADAREASAEEIRPGEDGRAFYRLSTPKKLVVMFGGPVMNLVIAFVLMAIALVGIGVEGPTLTVGDVKQCVLPATATSQTTCTSDDAVSPAALAGVQDGDTIASWDGKQVSTWAELVTAIRASGTDPVPVVVDRDGSRVELTVTPVLRSQTAVDTAGNAVTDASGAAVVTQSSYIGIAPLSAMARQSIWSVPGAVADTTRQTAAIVLTLPERVWQVAYSTFTGQPRDATSVIGIVGVGRIAGEVASVQGAGIDDSLRIFSLLQMLAALNVSLFVFNMIPLPPLDGGHIAAALWEGARRQVARVRGRTRPRPADTARLMPLSYAMFVVLGGMGLLLVWADIVNPVRLG
ncbi:MAG: site-2 protease family protein [Actinobacteria bacterium]|nr:site-2 protease family protein [Actinomycetota bacterium]MCG2802599.1 site-2 protease family protein [Cellulomonas sp.]